MSKYRKSFQIPFYDSDRKGRITPLALLSYLGETSGEHSEEIGFGYNQLRESGYAWMLNKWKVKINNYPKVKENIIIETWTSGIDRFYATREFLIYGSGGKELAKASTLWIFIDMDRKRPVRIPKDYIEMAKIVEEKPFDEFYEFERTYEIKSSLDFHIRRSDIDYNNHVNNTRYLAWILETVPNEVYEDYSLKEFEILYKKEITYGNTILSGSEELANSEEVRDFIHNIVHRDNLDSHALGWTRWELNR